MTGKKKIAFVFILATSLVMTAFIAIPHHHHDNLVCFERFHKDSREPNHENECNDPDHCFLNQVIDTPPEEVKECHDFSAYLNTLASDNFILHALPAGFENLFDPVFLNISKVPYEDTPAYTFFTAFSSELRVPPVS